MKVTVIGASGQLGQDVCAAFGAAGDAVTPLGHHDVDVVSAESVTSALNQSRPDIVVNTAAFHHVEKCEADPASSFAVNSLGARRVAQVADSLGATLVHISTDYVFDGRKQAPYTEQDAAAPLNAYGNSKLSGEFFVRCTYSALENAELKDKSINLFNHWKDGLKNYLVNREQTKLVQT